MAVDETSSEDAMNVDVVSANAETSAQAYATGNQTDSYIIVQDQDARSGFSAYTSPLDFFPSLRPRSHLDSFGEGISSGHQLDDGMDTSSISSSPRNTSIDLKDLKVAHSKNLLTDPSRPIYDETARYFYAHHAVFSGSHHSVKDIKDALENIRQRSPTKSFDDRVAEAVTLLGLR
ncbi:uncharacterized protein B0H18DRAFT_328925 [Fomitopsis serialis]|uniref:uncharacterized protein n=1 Tax=Fomitopsis serialis TaxID=139415 RepID=UPI002007F5EC|nr:uncharacterized protein B0H18DRAFT_328925 [Neoantrodia serialis]KAH9936662.1 hypothetical protein B0H18DRAFT_328925 [Neoantrodia serialis]